MRLNTLDEMIAVIQAHKEGKKLECRACWDLKGTWMGVGAPVFSFNQTEYRIKAEPIKKRKLYQFLCQSTGDKRYFVTANMMKDEAECMRTYRYSVVVKRLDHTMIEVEIEE